MKQLYVVVYCVMGGIGFIHLLKGADNPFDLPMFLRGVGILLALMFIRSIFDEVEKL